MPLDPALEPLLQQVNAMPPMSAGAPQQAREAFAQLTALAGAFAPPPEVASVSDLEVDGGAGKLPARLYLPAGAELPVPTLVFFHGGGFTIGDVASYDGQCRIICAGAGVAVLSVEYRLGPESKFPAAADDAIAATRWALDHADELGGDPAAIGVGGDSAGGNLAAVAAQAHRDASPPIKGQILIYPVTDFTAEHPSLERNGEGFFLTRDDMEWFRDNYIADAVDEADPKASPRLGDLTGLPPAVVVTAELDPLLDDGEAYADALEEAGVPVSARGSTASSTGSWPSGRSARRPRARSIRSARICAICWAEAPATPARPRRRVAFQG